MTREIPPSQRHRGCTRVGKGYKPVQNSVTTIAVDEELRKRIIEEGSEGERFRDVLRRLLDHRVSVIKDNQLILDRWAGLQKEVEQLTTDLETSHQTIVDLKKTVAELTKHKPPARKK